MDAIKLIWFESKKQITSFPFIITLVLLTVFSFTQMSEVFHIPVNSESDIQALDRAGERDFIDVSNTDEELKEKTSQYLEQMISAGTISDENAKEFEPVLTMLKDDNYTFDDIYLAMKDNSYIFPWLMASKSQFGNRLGTVDEVNSNIQAELGTKGYSPILMEKYITYVQGISAFLIFPLFLLLHIRDYRSNMYEVVYAQPLSPTKYILNRYLGIFIPFMLYLYLFGLILNLISVFRFIGSGYNVLYTPFISYFVIYLLPTTFFFSSLIMLLMLLIRKVVAVFPIYILYIIFNMTPGVFNDTSSWIRLANPIIRLDGDAITISSLIVNRSFYIVLGVVFLLLSCNVYRQLRTNLKKVISI